MLRILAGAIGRTVYGAYGALSVLRDDDGTVKEALAVYRLLRSCETEGLTVEQAIAIAQKARVHKLDPFDLWMTWEAYVCDDLDHAVTKALEMRALYANPPLRPN
jgi:hypothetical protein